MKSLSALLLFLFAGPLSGSALPGFRVQALGVTSGFASSIAVDSHGILYYTTTGGDLFRFEAGISTRVAHVPTFAIGDAGLLGMALRDDSTAVVHYVAADQSADVISLIDLATGTEKVLHSFVGDISFPGRPVPVEHHGGNPTVASDGSIFVGIGDYGGGAIAAMREWNAGKIWRIAPDGSATQFARGFRNPFDLAWDAARQRLVLTDNGAVVDDEIDLVTEGGYYGWPYTAGNQPAIAGAVPPAYTFPKVVAPTGLAALDGRNPMLGRGYLLGAFVSKAIYWVPDVDARPFPAPIPLIAGETGSVIDVVQGRDGAIYFTTPTAIYQLLTPMRGDCNGDGVVDWFDLSALALELADGNPEAVTDAPGGRFGGSWGCDVNGDGVIDSEDSAALAAIVRGRGRVVKK